MPRRKGDGKGKTGGRKPGTTNKITKDVRTLMAALAENNIDKAQKMLDMIVEPDKWMSVYLRLCEFSVPKMAAVQISAAPKTISKFPTKK